ncbi:hypothetical protein IWQ61_001854 [Dispira simplex]|nr:hypothetical protein IWQ61_001854 [Dispira simplex]
MEQNLQTIVKRLEQELEAQRLKLATIEQQLSLKPEQDQCRSAPLANRIQPFKGSITDDVEGWFDHITVVLCPTNTSEEDLVSYAALQLRGMAWEWFRTAEKSKGSQLTWLEFNTEIRTQFRKVQIERMARDLLLNLRQTGTTEQYVADFQALSSRVPSVSELNKINLFTQGLDLLASRTIARRLNSLESCYKVFSST